MRDTTERDSLAIADLIIGLPYEFITPRGNVYRGVWEGMDGHSGGVRFPPGAIDLFPHGTTIVYPVRYWSSCTITPIDTLHQAETRLDARDNTESFLESQTAAGDKQAAPLRLACIVGVAVLAAAVAWIWWR